MNKKRDKDIYRLLPAGFFVLIGLALFFYGIAFSRHTASSGDPNSPAPGSSVRETDMIKQMTIGGISRDESGKIKAATYDPGQAPQACPT